MDMNIYQKWARETAIYPGQGEVDGLMYVGLGLASEAGEVAGKIKKILRDDNRVVTPERKDAILDELGDTLWYIALVAAELDTKLYEVAIQNLKKLQVRNEMGTLGGSGDAR